MAPAGFSLIEVLIASGLLSTALVALAQVFVIATRANVDARDTTSATVLAVQKIEEFRAAPPTSSVDAVEYLDIHGAVVADAAGAESARYRRRSTVTRLWPDRAETIVITVAVSPKQIARDVAQLTTIRTRRRE